MQGEEKAFAAPLSANHAQVATIRFLLIMARGTCPARHSDQVVETATAIGRHLQGETV